MTDSLTTRWDVLDEAHRALRATVAGLGATDLSLVTPCTLWNVTQVLQHAAGDQLAYAARITGGPGPAENPFEPSGRPTEDVRTLVDDALRESAAAWRTVTRGADVLTPLPQGQLPAWLAVGACALDAAVHAWDVAVASGQQSPIQPALASELMVVAEGIVEPLRAYGVYAAVLPPADGDDEVARLLRYLGRMPDWHV